MTNPHPYSRTETEKTAARNQAARQIIAGFSTQMPALADILAARRHRTCRQPEPVGRSRPAEHRTGRRPARPRQPARRDARRHRRARRPRTRPPVLHPRRAERPPDARPAPREGIMTGYRQMRRQARHARRAGMQPMMVISSDHRSPSWPSWSSPGGRGATAASLRPSASPAWWRAWGGTRGRRCRPGGRSSSPSRRRPASALAAFGATLGLPTLAERLYVAVTVLACGTWDALAAAAGPAHLSAPAGTWHRRAGPVGAVVG